MNIFKIRALLVVGEDFNGFNDFRSHTEGKKVFRRKRSVLERVVQDRDAFGLSAGAAVGHGYAVAEFRHADLVDLSCVSLACDLDRLAEGIARESYDFHNNTQELGYSQ